MIYLVLLLDLKYNLIRPDYICYVFLAQRCMVKYQAAIPTSCGWFGFEAKRVCSSVIIRTLLQNGRPAVGLQTELKEPNEVPFKLDFYFNRRRAQAILGPAVGLQGHGIEGAEGVAVPPHAWGRWRPRRLISCVRVRVKTVDIEVVTISEGFTDE